METKREIELYAALTGLNQKDIVAASWHEFKQRHVEEFRRGLAWASGILENPGAAAVAASGMSAEDVAEIQAAFTGAGAPSALETAVRSQP